MQCKDQGLVGGAYPISWHYVNSLWLCADKAEQMLTGGFSKY